MIVVPTDEEIVTVTVLALLLLLPQPDSQRQGIAIAITRPQMLLDFIPIASPA
jgi:hypothetical protein